MAARWAKRGADRLKAILVMERSYWDSEGLDPDARSRFLRTLECRTSALGSRLYGSDNGEEVILFNTCKSPACTCCGNWATIQWQRERWCALPEGPYKGRKQWGDEGYSREELVAELGSAFLRADLELNREPRAKTTPLMSRHGWKP